MKKVFTHKNSEKKEPKVVAPSEKTMNFLKQFAHTYHVEKSLPKAINELCTN